MEEEDSATATATATAAATAASAATATAGSQQQDDSDADPIVASYTVFTNPTLPASRQLLILQQPNRKLSSPSSSSSSSSSSTSLAPDHRRQHAPELAISEVRLKPRTGMVEVDVPVSHAHADYDREKGLRWGGALQRSVAAKGGGSHGLAGGFGVGVPAARGRGGGGAAAAAAGPGRRRGGQEEEEDLDLDMLADWSEAVRRDKVLRTQTLGGQYPLEAESNCRWMVGVFQGDQLHLTPATSLIHLRPQLHHIDAYTEQERLSRPREAGAGAASSSTSGAAGAGSKDGAAGSSSSSAGGPPAAAPRAITMTIKSASTNEIAQETMTDRLRAVQTEPWSRLRYESDTSDRAWDMFGSHLLYKGPAAPGGSPRKGARDRISKGKGKGKEGEEAAAEEEETAAAAGEDLESAAPRLAGRWTEAEFLRAVSGRLGEGAEADGGAAEQAGEGGSARGKKEEGDTTATAAAGGSKAKGKAAAAPATTARRAGGKGKSVAFKGTAMEID